MKSSLYLDVTDHRTSRRKIPDLTCVNCGSSRIWSLGLTKAFKRYKGGRRYHCQECNHKFKVTLNSEGQFVPRSSETVNYLEFEL